MDNLVVTVNAGSSSIKADVFALGREGPERIAAETVQGLGDDRDSVLDRLLDTIGGHRIDWEQVVAVGHRVAHGGLRHIAPEVVDEDVLVALEAVVPLAPLHVPHNLVPLRRIAEQRPGVTQVACFDTAFHATMPRSARYYALPRALAERGLVRYGFHGLSYEHVAHVLPALLPSLADGGIVVAHLGAGASLCAMRHRQSVATTMGFTPLDGIPMATRSGAVDPGLLLHLLREGTSVDELDDLLNRRSGLLGLSGISGDTRDLVSSDDPRATEALEHFTYRVRQAIGALAADLEGLDALVFTGGIGEHQPAVRRAVCAGLGWLGVELDPTANDVGAARIDAATSRVAVLVIPADEAEVIARHAVDAVS